MDITQITELAKQGGRLASDKQWELADALTLLTDTQISQVAIASKRNESTLHQYARAAERWPQPDRVEGVSFSAHRVALSWHNPRALLVELKHKHGSPTVKQVRQAMGLEGHPAIELGEKMLSKIDRSVSVQALNDIVRGLLTHISELDSGADEEEYDQNLDTEALPQEEEDNTYRNPNYEEDRRHPNEGECKNCGRLTREQYTDGTYLCDNCDEGPGIDMEDEAAVQVEDDTSKRWTPPINTSDIAGI